MTISIRPPEVSTGAPDSVRRLRRSAITCIAVGMTPVYLREGRAGTPDEALSFAVAAEIEELTARGVTQRAASRVVRERGRANPCGGKLDEHGARQVARIYLTEMTPGDVRGHARAATRRHKRMFRMIADAMDALLAEGFDPAALAESLKSTEED